MERGLWSLAGLRITTSEKKDRTGGEFLTLLWSLVIQSFDWERVPERNRNEEGERDPFIGTVIHRWSFSYEGEFTSYKHKLSTVCIQCAARHVIQCNYNDGLITRHHLRYRTGVDGLLILWKHLKSFEFLIVKPDSSFPIIVENPEGRQFHKLILAWDLILLASEGYR